jgi:hypothetical protein
MHKEEQCILFAQFNYFYCILLEAIVITMGIGDEAGIVASCLSRDSRYGHCAGRGLQSAVQSQ